MFAQCGIKWALELEVFESVLICVCVSTVSSRLILCIDKDALENKVKNARFVRNRYLLIPVQVISG